MSSKAVGLVGAFCLVVAAGCTTEFRPGPPTWGDHADAGPDDRRPRRPPTLEPLDLATEGTNTAIQDGELPTALHTAAVGDDDDDRIEPPVGDDDDDDRIDEAEGDDDAIEPGDGTEDDDAVDPPSDAEGDDDDDQVDPPSDDRPGRGLGRGRGRGHHVR